MVRLEKIIYEKLVNTQTLKRARVLGAPQKWYNESRDDAYKVSAYKLFREGISARIYRMLEPVIARLTYQWYRDYALQRGMALEDYFLFEERELRRCYFFNQVIRQSLHPYMWILFAKRRARFYKVDRAVRGFYVPDYLRQEGANRLAADTAENRDTWNSFVYKNFMSDMTPSTRFSVLPRWIPLEVFSVFGVFRHEAWDRLFFNEANYENYSAKEIEKANDPFSFCGDLDTEAGRNAFRDEVKRFIGLYPGSIVREGEEFDFDAFFARRALRLGKDTSKFNQSVVARLQDELKQGLEAKDEKKCYKKKPKILGSSLPFFLRSGPKAVQNS